jgi:hypothetical protein
MAGRATVVNHHRGKRSAGADRILISPALDVDATIDSRC